MSSCSFKLYRPRRAQPPSRIAGLMSPSLIRDAERKLIRNSKSAKDNRDSSSFVFRFLQPNLQNARWTVPHPPLPPPPPPSRQLRCLKRPLDARPPNKLIPGRSRSTSSALRLCNIAPHHWLGEHTVVFLRVLSHHVQEIRHFAYSG